jgi:hypothetical protein
VTRSSVFKAGMVLCALLAALDIVGLAGFATDDGPPAVVMIVGAAFGVITLAALRPALAGQRGGVATVGWSRALSALWGIPVFFVDSAPTWARIVVAAGIALTVLALAMIYSDQRHHSYSAATP